MGHRKLVSIVIPTLNSDKTLRRCLESIKSQAYKNIEIIIVDSFSADRTLEIAQKYKCRIIKTRWKLLGARYLGMKEAAGDVIVYIDSDQILKNRYVIGRVETLAKRHDMIVLEEFGYKPSTLLQKMANEDRMLVQSLKKEQMDPINGVILPRVFRRRVLEAAFRRIDIKRLHDVVIFDHAIIYYEAWKLSKDIVLLDNAVYHNDPSDLITFMKHNYRYGVTSKQLAKTGMYTEILRKRARFRSGALKATSAKAIASSYALLSLKGVAYMLGYLIGRGYIEA